MFLNREYSYFIIVCNFILFSK